MSFFQEVVTDAGGAQIASLSAYGGRPVYEHRRGDTRVAYFFPGVGAPAAVATMEEMIAHGCRTFVAVGGAGALVHDLAMGHAMVVDRALRDEGTSHHYLAPSRFVGSDPHVTDALVSACGRAGLKVMRGDTWTTSRIQRRVAEGCSMVEMEAAAFLAVAQFRGARIGQLLYAGDTLAAADWNDRDWTNATQIRRSLFDISLDAALALADELPTPSD